jgi:hypothetical protein
MNGEHYHFLIRCVILRKRSMKRHEKREERQERSEKRETREARKGKNVRLVTVMFSGRMLKSERKEAMAVENRVSLKAFS